MASSVARSAASAGDIVEAPDAGEPPSPHRRFFISALTIEHFRSFGDACTLSLKPGFTVIVGHNGSGKSNAIDALLFALAQDHNTLRCRRSFHELRNTRRRGPCVVSVRVSVPAATAAAEGDAHVQQSNGLHLLAHAKDDGQRAFKLNGAAATVVGVKDALLRLGLDASTPNFAVRQHAAAMPIDAKGLTALLQQASGAARWLGAAEAASKEIGKEQGALAKVRADIADLEDLLAKEAAAQKALAALAALRRRERLTRARMQRTAAAAASRLHEARHAGLDDAHARSAAAAARVAEVRGLLAELEGGAVEARKRARGQRPPPRRVAAAAAARDAADEATPTSSRAALADELAVARARLEARSGARRKRRTSGGRWRASCVAPRAPDAAAARAATYAQAANAAVRKASAAASGGWLLDKLTAAALARAETRKREAAAAAARARAAADDASRRMEGLTQASTAASSERSDAEAALAALEQRASDARRRAAAKAAAARIATRSLRVDGGGGGGDGEEQDEEEDEEREAAAEGWDVDDMAALVARAAAREAEAVAAVAKAEARKHRATLTLAPLLLRRHPPRRPSTRRRRCAHRCASPRPTIASSAASYRSTSSRATTSPSASRQRARTHSPSCVTRAAAAVGCACGRWARCATPTSTPSTSKRGSSGDTGGSMSCDPRSSSYRVAAEGTMAAEAAAADGAAQREKEA